MSKHFCHHQNRFLQTPPPHSGHMIFRVHMPDFAGRISKSRCALQSDESRLEYCENEQSHHVQIGVR